MFKCPILSVSGTLYMLHSSWKHRITFTGKVGFITKVKATVKVNCWVPLAYHMCTVEIETEQHSTVVYILVLATCTCTYTVSRS